MKSFQTFIQDQKSIEERTDLSKDQEREQAKQSSIPAGEVLYRGWVISTMNTHPRSQQVDRNPQYTAKQFQAFINHTIDGLSKLDKIRAQEYLVYSKSQNQAMIVNVDPTGHSDSRNRSGRPQLRLISFLPPGAQHPSRRKADTIKLIVEGIEQELTYLVVD